MSNTLLLYVAMFVFSMMVLGLALTMFEFRSMRAAERSESEPSGSRRRSDVKRGDFAPQRAGGPQSVPVHKQSRVRSSA